MRTYTHVLSFILVASALSGGCQNSANEAESNQMDSQQALYTRNQPIPTFQWSLERHLLVQLYQARNQTVATYSYVINPFTNSISWECQSMGFPIPATTQLTNPQTTVTGYQSITTVAQPEPNGVFAPPVTSGTWVLCASDDGSGNLEPVYVEEHVRTYTRPMEMRDGHLVPVAGQRSSVTLNPRR